MPTNTQVLLDHRPTDKVSPACFRIVETPVPTPGPGEVLVRHTFLSLDPYMRGRLSDAKSYAKPQEIGAVMGGGTVGVVEASNNPRFQSGDAVVGMGGWQLYSVSDGAALRVVDAKAIPIQAYLGPVGMPGVTAWYGLNRIIAPKAGETVLVSAATGAVGSVVGQLAKIAGARPVGIAGGKEKCAYAVNELGYGACVDHKSQNFGEELKAALPDGIDGLFENVGGEPFRLAHAAVNDFARIAICGLIASYEGGPPTGARHAHLPRQANQNGRLHRLGSFAALAAGDRRTRRPHRRQEADLARDDPRRSRKRAPGAGRPAEGREFRQDAGQGRLRRAARRKASALAWRDKY